MANKKVELLNSWLAEMGLHVECYSPGDGLTRYRFLPLGKGYWDCDGIICALGWSEAEQTARALLIGWRLHGEVHYHDKKYDDAVKAAYENPLAPTAQR